MARPTANVSPHHWHTARSGVRVESRFSLISGEVDSFGVRWSGRMSTESASGYTWYVPAGLSALNSASGAQVTEVIVSATGAASAYYRVSAHMHTSGSARNLLEYFDVEIIVP